MNEREKSGDRRLSAIKVESRNSPYETNLADPSRPQNRQNYGIVNGFEGCKGPLRVQRHRCAQGYPAHVPADPKGRREVKMRATAHANFHRYSADHGGHRLLHVPNEPAAGRFYE